MIKKRIFFPIGQGAFYAEIHENFSMVYDCGVGHSFSIPTHAQNVIAHAAKYELDRDIILFISHFDTDHISGIETLKNELRNNGKKITCVVMPLLYDAQKSIIKAFLNRQGILNTDIIDKPEEFFGEETKIVSVDSTETANEENDPIIITRSNSPTTIPNGTKLAYSNNDWIFVPHNYDYFPRKKYVENLILAQGINLHQFKTDPAYALKEINNNPVFFQSIYNSATGLAHHGYGSVINENSLFLYSGPTIKKRPLHPPYCLKNHPCNINNISIHILLGHHRNSGCIYTGDGNLNLVNIAAIFNNYLVHVGTVQIPHHGSAGNFNQSFFQNNSYICPMSVGHNYKKFPSYTVLNQLALTSCHAFVIDETSALVQFF